MGGIGGGLKLGIMALVFDFSGLRSDFEQQFVHKTKACFQATKIHYVQSFHKGWTKTHHWVFLKTGAPKPQMEHFERFYIRINQSKYRGNVLKIFRPKLKVPELDMFDTHNWRGDLDHFGLAGENI